MPSDEDAAAVAAFRAGDPEGFEILFRKYRRRVYAQAWRMLRDEGLAMDVVQDCFLALLGVLPRWEPRARLTTWLAETVWRLAQTQRRRRPGPGPVDVQAPAVAPALEAAERSRGLWEAVDALPARQREAVLLRFGQDLSVRETAAEMGLTPGAVGAHLARALAALRQENRRFA